MLSVEFPSFPTRRSSDLHAPNILTDLPPAILNFPDYVASGFNGAGTAAKNILGAGYPPDIVSGATSLWGLYSAQFWEVTQDRKSTRLNSSHVKMSYAVLC